MTYYSWHYYVICWCGPMFSALFPGALSVCRAASASANWPFSADWHWSDAGCQSMVLTRLDFGNSFLAGLPVYLTRRLQSMLNTAARLTYMIPPPPLRPYHWCAGESSLAACVGADRLQDRSCAHARTEFFMAARLSVCPSVTIRYRVQIRWNSSKIISRPNSLRPTCSLTPNMGDLEQREHPQN